MSYGVWNYFVGRGQDAGKADDAYYQELPSDVNKDAVETLLGLGKKKRDEVKGSVDYARM